VCVCVCVCVCVFCNFTGVYLSIVLVLAKVCNVAIQEITVVF